MVNSTNQPRRRTRSDLLRASDADRDRVARVLADALVDGRLTPDEHTVRLEAVYAAKTMGELSPLTVDLAPAPAAGADPAAADARPGSDGAENIVAVFSSTGRSGRWLVEPRTNTSTLFGSVSLDLREAVLPQREVTIQCAVVFGELKVLVPPGVRVVDQTVPVFGEVSLKKLDSATAADAPTVRLTGMVVFGEVKVRTRGPGEKKSTWFR